MRLKVRTPTASDNLSWDNSDSLLGFLLLKGYQVDHSCGGSGTCGTCRYTLVRGSELIDPPSELEQEWASARGGASALRLSCQTFKLHNETSQRDGAAIEVEYDYALK